MPYYGDYTLTCPTIPWCIINHHQIIENWLTDCPLHRGYRYFWQSSDVQRINMMPVNENRLKFQVCHHFSSYSLIPHCWCRPDHSMIQHWCCQPDHPLQSKETIILFTNETSFKNSLIFSLLKQMQYTIGFQLKPFESWSDSMQFNPFHSIEYQELLDTNEHNKTKHKQSDNPSKPFNNTQWSISISSLPVFCIWMLHLLDHNVSVLICEELLLRVEETHLERFFVFKECKNGHKTQTAKFYGFFLLKETNHLECQRSVCVWPWLKWVYTVLILFNIEMNHKLRKIWWFGAEKTAECEEKQQIHFN